MIEILNKQNYFKYLKTNDLKFFNLIKSNKFFLKEKNSLILLKSSVKRFIYFSAYQDILYSKNKLNILDIGGSINMLTPFLSKKHNYTLCDNMIIKNKKYLKKIPKFNFLNYDWNELNLSKKGIYDIIISNDLFPNVDQRLDRFIKKFRKKTKKFKIVLTAYSENLNKVYKARRLDGDEILSVRPLNKNDIILILKKNKITKINNLKKNFSSLFENKRSLYILNLNYEKKY